MKRGLFAAVTACIAIQMILSLPAPAAAKSRYDTILKTQAGRDKLAALARMEDAGSIDPAALEPLIADREPLIRARCAEVLGRIGNPSGVAYLAKLADDASDAVVTTAVYSLGLVGGAASLEPLKRALGERSAAVKPYALEALGRTGLKEAAAIIDPWLRNFNGSIRAQACLALAFTGDSAAASELDASIQDPDPHVDACAAYAMGRLGYREGIERLAGLLAHEDAEVRFRAIEAFGRLKADEPVPLIARLTTDPDRWVAVKAAEAIGRIGSKKGAAALVELLASKDDYLKTVALNGLAVVGDKGQFEAVKPLLGDPSPMVRRAALGAAATTGGDDARTYLLAAFRHGTSPEKSTALELLGKLGNSDDLLPLVKALGTAGDRLVREGAAAGLGNWPKAGELEEPCGYEDTTARKLTPVEALFEAANGGDWVVASIAIESLGKVGPIEIVPDLIHVYDAHASYNDGDRKLAVVEAIGSNAKKIDAALTEKFALGGFFARAAAEADLRVARAAALAAAKFGIKLEAAPSGTWKRGAYPWGEPALPLGERKILVTTARGDIEILLYGDEAPNAVESILTLAGKGFFNGLNFHRVVPGFVIQGGCPRGDGWGDAGYLLRNEVNMHRYERGTVGMADSGKDTAGSQFFITHTAQPHLNGRYVIIGKVTRGMNVADLIEEGDVFSVKVVE
ncbi:MAG: HEAT repeat domain-containing protein [Candidatus Krumholzibacteriaceae bacterium]